MDLDAALADLLARAASDRVDDASTRRRQRRLASAVSAADADLGALWTSLVGTDATISVTIRGGTGVTGAVAAVLSDAVVLRDRAISVIPTHTVVAVETDGVIPRDGFGGPTAAASAIDVWETLAEDSARVQLHGVPAVTGAITSVGSRLVTVQTDRGSTVAIPVTELPALSVVG